MKKRRPLTKTPHWNQTLRVKWKDMRNARSKVLKSRLDIDWRIFEKRRKHFEQENRKAKRRFNQRTTELLKKGPGSRMAEAIKRDRRRREERQKDRTLNDRELNPADFTKIMGSYHDQDQVIVDLRHFSVEEDWVQDIEQSIRRSKNNKAPGKDGVHNEILKLEPALMSRLILEMWRIVGKSKTYRMIGKRIS